VWRERQESDGSESGCGDSALVVGGELKHFGRNRIDTGGEIFLLLKHVCCRDGDGDGDVVTVSRTQAR
jgi:hypothetical protein